MIEIIFWSYIICLCHIIEKMKTLQTFLQHYQLKNWWSHVSWIVKKIERISWKAPTCGHCAEVGRKRPFHHRGLAPFVTWPAVGTYGTWNVSSLPSPPPEIIWQCPFDQRSAAASPMEVKCIKLYRYVIVLWISILDCITIVSVVLPRGFPYWVWMMFKIYGYM